MNIGIKAVSYVVQDTEDNLLYPTDGVKICYDKIRQYVNGKINKIIYVSTTIPEYIFWADYAKIHHEIGEKDASIMKMYQGKTSLLAAVDYAKAILNVDDKVNNILLLSGESYCNMSDRFDEVGDCVLADGCSAILLSCDVSDMVVELYKTNIIKGYENLFYYPTKAQHSYEDISDIHSLYLKYRLNEVAVEGFDIYEYVNIISSAYCEIINDILIEEKISIDNVRKIVVPNIGECYIKEICEKLNISQEKLSWMGCHKFGHFGTGDLFINLKYLSEINEIEKNDYVILVSHSYEGRISAIKIRI